MNQTRAITGAILLALAAAAHADGPLVGIQFGIGAPPPMYAPVPPSMIWLPEISMYVALGVDRPIFYLGGVYYFNDGGIWYSGPQYGGPWRRLWRPPQGLRRVDPRDWDRYQADARRHADDARWRHFRAAPQPRGPDMRRQPWGPGPRPQPRGPEARPQPRGAETRGPQRDQHRDQHREQHRDEQGH